MGYLVGLAAALALAIPAAASALPSLAANPANKLLARGIDPIQYDRATKCNGGKVWAGTVAMVGWLQRNAAGVDWGEYRCEMWGKGEASIHSAGRAIDWHPATMRDGHALVKLLLAPDKSGNAAALARRMGVQGIIFDCQSWFGGGDGSLGDYSYCYGKNGKRKKNIDKTQAHIDHVHIELNMRGAKKRTTFWNKGVSYDLPAPVQQPTQPAQPTQPTPAPQQPWTGVDGGTQVAPTGGAWH
jgi:hypothetical protein